MPKLTTNGAVVAYSDTGAPPGRPDARTIVFGHGLLFSAWMFAAQIEALRSTYRCVAIDWRGQGASPPAQGGYDMDTLTPDAIAVIEELGTAPVHWVGLSMGGFVGQRIGARRPELLRSLTLINTSPDRESLPVFVKEVGLSTVYPLVGVLPLRTQVMKSMFASSYRKDPKNKPVIDEWLAQVARTDRRGLRRAILGVAFRKPVAAEIRSIKTPTLVIGGAEDASLRVNKSRRIAEAIPGARLEIIPDAAHSTTIERPEVVTSLMSSFLAEVDASN